MTRHSASRLGSHAIVELIVLDGRTETTPLKMWIGVEGIPSWQRSPVDSEGRWVQAVAAGEPIKIRVGARLHRARDLVIPSLEPGTTHTETVLLEPCPRVGATVRVVDAIGRPVAGARVQLVGSKSEHEPIVESNEQGEVRLSFVDVSEGRFRGRVEADGFATRTFRANRRRSGDVIVKPTSLLAHARDAIVLDTAMDVTGTVVAPSGQGVAGAIIRVSPPRMSGCVVVSTRFPGHWETRSRADGSYQISGLPCGVLLNWSVAGPTGDRACATPLRLGLTNARGVQCDWMIAPAVRITGELRAPDGRPVPNASLCLLREPPHLSSKERILAWGFTDALGFFDMKTVTLRGPGTLDVPYAIRGGGRIADAPFTVHQRLDLQLGDMVLEVVLTAERMTSLAKREEVGSILNFVTHMRDDPNGTLGSIINYGLKPFPS